MGEIQKIDLSISSNPFYLIAGLILLALYSFYVYRITIPAVSKLLRFLLTALRSSAILLILFLIFEPLLSIQSASTQDQKILIFVDNSRSIAFKDKDTRKNSIEEAIAAIDKAAIKNLKYYLFGNSPKPLNDGPEVLSFNEPVTNFSKIIDIIKKEADELSAAVIISDGIITDGTEPLYEAEKTGVPIFTIGVGDTSTLKDVYIDDLIFNQYIYAGKQTTIEARIVNYGLGNKEATVSLFDENKAVASKNIVLNSGGLNKVPFEFTPLSGGERRLRLSVSTLAEEKNKENNSRSFFLNILSNKIKIGLVAGSPSADLSAICGTLEKDRNLEVIKFVEVAPNRNYGEQNLKMLDSADVLILIGFPTASSSNSLLEKTFSAIKNGKPFLFLLSQEIDLNKLRNIGTHLPFTVPNAAGELATAQPEIVQSEATGLFTSIHKNEIWNNLTPVFNWASGFNAKPESKILAKAKIRNVPTNIPLILSRSVAGQRSISFLFQGLWKWNLGTAEKDPSFLPGLLNGVIRWLNLNDTKKQFSLRTNKKIYSNGEQVEFTAELYDQTLSPIDSAEVTVTITNGTMKYELQLDALGGGIFRNAIENGGIGDYTYTAVAKFDGTIKTSSPGRFTVEEGEIEFQNTKMNLPLLAALANSTGGNYCSIESAGDLRDELIKRSSQAKVKTSFFEFEISFNGWILFLIICLFVCEWFIRKRAGMI